MVGGNGVLVLPVVVVEEEEGLVGDMICLWMGLINGVCVCVEYSAELDCVMYYATAAMVHLI